MNFAAPQAAVTFQRASFKGNATEYFGIWIVNILLTIVTLGVYSAWAKVRRNRYFYGNTELMDHSFDYHAKGKQIFIGRLIVFVYIVVYNLTLTFVPYLGAALGIGILLFMPWLIVRSLRFHMRVTSYRNVRFDFVGGAGGAFVSVFLGSMVSLLSLGLLAPFATRWLNRYVVNNIRYGGRPLATTVTTGKIYGAWILPASMVVMGVAVLGALAAYGGPMVKAWYDSTDMPQQQRIGVIVALVYAVLIPVIIVYALAGIIYKVAVRNAVFNATLFDGQHPLISDLGRARYIWIAFSNTILVLLTFGLMRPWAAVRERRYIAEHTGIAIVGDVGEVMSNIQATGSAISAEYVDMEGFDFGF
jgi:uncharacterized membrane protein YjgN (DUF898 family)